MQIRVWTDTARARFLTIRRKWDPDGLFPGYKAFTVGVENDMSL